jgi:hypothetical protein
MTFWQIWLRQLIQQPNWWCLGRSAEATSARCAWWARLSLADWARLLPVRQPLLIAGAAPLNLGPGHLVNATAASAAEANNCRRADLAVIHPRCCHSRPASESPAITTSPNGMER